MSDFLREVVEKGLNAPSGERICTCHNPNAVKEGLETPCWYCELHAALASRPVEAKADAGGITHGRLQHDRIMSIQDKAREIDLLCSALTGCPTVTFGDLHRPEYLGRAARICALFEGAGRLAVSTRMVLHCAGEAVAYWLEAIEDGGEALDAAMEKLADALKDDAKYRLTHGILDRSEPLCACGKERDHPLHSPINTSGHRYNPTALTRPAPADALREDHL